MRPTSRHPARPVLITEAPVNADDEYNLRRKKYLIMMIIRALCIIGAASTFSYSGWLAAAFVAAALVLPWSAVLIANNRPPKQALRFRRFLPGNLADRELTAGGASADQFGSSDRFGSADRFGSSDQFGSTSREAAEQPEEHVPHPDSQAGQPAHRIIDI